MSQTLTGTSTDPTTTPSATAVADLDTGNAANLNSLGQACLNFITWLRTNCALRNMSGGKITNLGNGTAVGDAVAFGQLTASRIVVAQNDTTFFNQVAGPGGWQGSASRPVSYWKDLSGQLRMYGDISPLNNNGTSQLFTLPVGYRPPYNTPFVLKVAGSPTLYSGSISASTGVATADAGLNATSVYALDLISFPTF